MKKAIYLIIALIGLSASSCSSSMLEFSPTDSGSGEELLKSASTAITSDGPRRPTATNASVFRPIIWRSTAWPTT